MYIFWLLYLIEIAGATPKCHFFSKIFFVPILYWPISWENLFAGVPAWKSCFLNNPNNTQTEMSRHSKSYEVVAKLLIPFSSMNTKLLCCLPSSPISFLVDHDMSFPRATFVSIVLVSCNCHITVFVRVDCPNVSSVSQTFLPWPGAKQTGRAQAGMT